MRYHSKPILNGCKRQDCQKCSHFHRAEMAIPLEQKAFRLTASQGDFSVDTIPVPQPLDDEVLVRIESATLSHVEKFMQKTGYSIVEYPSVVGLDAAGVVVALGKSVSIRAIGDRV